MSLFRVRNFWSFNLSQLHADHESRQTSPSGPYESRANFAMCPGNFLSIGPHDVFVCASLEGLLCIVQVPESKQKQIHKDNTNITVDTNNQEPKDDHQLEDHQLLAAKQLGFPIVDIKCGYFLSSLKQSIAVLTFDRIIFYHVKRKDRKSDKKGNESKKSLWSEIKIKRPNGDNAHNSTSNEDELLFDDNLFSQRFEERLRIDLLERELASTLVILDDHHHLASPSNESKSVSSLLSQHNYRHESSSSGRDQAPKSDNSSGYRSRTPQRNSIIVQYTNQFIFTIIDNKKVAGHFWLNRDDASKQSDVNPTSSASIGESPLQKMTQHLGQTPIAVIQDSRQSYIIVGLTDYTIYSIAWSELMAAAKMNTVKIVAQNLFSNMDSSQHSEQSNKSHSPISAGIIKIDLDSMSVWCKELIYMPLEFIAVPRSKPQIITNTTNHNDNKPAKYSPGDQLMVMSRYNLDLLSNSGEHLWSHKFELPLVCLSSYIIESSSKVDKSKNDESLMTLVCTDCLSDERSNLLIFSEDRIVWSAMLDMKPIKIVRVDLSRIPGCLISLDARESHLTASYLGTNVESDTINNSDNDCDEYRVSQLETLDMDILANDNDGSLQGQTSKSDDARLPTLSIDVQQEASDHWPNAYVDCTIIIRQASKSMSVLNNFSAILEFDDLINFEPTHQMAQSIWSKSPRNVTKIDLGSWWPDRREPIIITGRFALSSSSKRSMMVNENDDEMASSNWKNSMLDISGLMPKSLEVNMCFRFNDARSGTVIQEQSFLLPLSLIATIAHIDYSDGQGRNLDDIQTNLTSYKRNPATNQMGNAELEHPTSALPYHFVNFVLGQTNSIELVELVDIIIEDDLICRAIDARQSPSQQSRRLKHSEVLEKLTLLAQSLDCRLKFKRLNPTEDTNFYDTDEDESHLAVVSLALKIPQVSYDIEIESCSVKTDEVKHTTVWVHVFDLNISSKIPEQLVRQAMKEWKIYNVQTASNILSKKSTTSKILVSIECELPVPVLFIYAHLDMRFRSYEMSKSGKELMLSQLFEKDHDSIEINYYSIFEINDFLAINYKLHESLKLVLSRYNDLLDKFKVLKNDLNQSYCKFRICTMVLLASAKRLSDLPENLHRSFTLLSQLTKQYQLSLLKKLAELEQLKILEYKCSKIPHARDIMLETRSNDFCKLPDFQQIM